VKERGDNGGVAPEPPPKKLFEKSFLDFQKPLYGEKLRFSQW